jgi:putative Holliday junction resolvase
MPGTPEETTSSLMTSSGQLASKRFLAFDFGTKCIGVAVGQTLTGTATPLDALKARDGIPNWDDVAKLIETWQPDGFVVGIPLTMEGVEGEIALRARKFGNRLHGRFHKPCFEMDERLSSCEAESYADASGTSISIDSIAAGLILESWFRQAQPAADTSSQEQI